MQSSAFLFLRLYTALYSFIHLDFYNYIHFYKIFLCKILSVCKIVVPL